MTERIEPTTESGALPGLDGKDNILGAPETKQKSKTNVGKLFILIAILMALLFTVFGVMWYMKGRAAKAVQQAVTKEKEEQTFTQRNIELANANIEKTKAELKIKEGQDAAEVEKVKALADAERARVAAEQAQRNPGAPRPAAGPATGAAAGPATGQQGQTTTPADRRMGGAVLVDYMNASDTGGRLGSATAQNQSGNATAQPRAASGAAGGTLGGGTTTLGAQLNATPLEARMASRLPNLTYLLKKGMDIPCELKTGIDTTLPGFVICKVLNDVYSANHKTLLIERGADVFGEQQTALKPGQARTFVLWTRIDNPSGVSMNIDSPATDAMGMSGIAGYVDAHFLERFGGAILMSLIQDVAKAAASTGSSGSGNTISFGGTADSASSTSTEVIKNTINIPPNLVVNVGQIVHVLVARDVSFESVYTLVQ